MSEDQPSADSQEPSLEEEEEMKVATPSYNAGDPVVFENDIEIYPDQRFEELDSGLIKAYGAGEAQGDTAKYFALICEKHLIPRHKAREVYASIINPRVVTLVRAGIVYWPPVKEQRYVFVYKRIHGKALITDGQPLALGIRSDEIIKRIVQPLVGVLQDFRDKDFVHGSIRPDNIYERIVDGKSDSLVLGDCLSTPASYNQPVLFETIARGKADPIGRGLGTRSDDMYAFGVTLAVLMRTNDGFAGMDTEELIRQKMNNGSFNVLINKERFQGSVLELLRGLLHDDEAQRWTIDDVLTWLDGRRLQPKQGRKQHKAARPLSYCGKKYFYPSFLAMDLDVNPEETQRLVESEELEQWISRSLEDAETLERVKIGVKSARERGTGMGYEDRLVANVSSALDPDAPLRYRGLRVMAGSVGSALAEALILKQDIKPFADMFAQNVMLTWIGAQISSNLDFGSLIASFDDCRMFVAQQKIGYGIERCVYILSEEAFCLSDKLKGYYVLSSEDMVRSFADLCEKGKAPKYFLDRHSIAFLSIRDSKLLEKTIYDLDSSDSRKRVLAELRVMASIQKRERLPKFPAMGKVFHERLSCVYETLKDQKVRDKTVSAMKSLAAKGSLTKMVDMIFDGNLFKNDSQEFLKIRAEFEALQKEHAEITLGLENKKAFGKQEARGYSVIVSGLVSGFSILLLFFLFFTKGLSF